MAKYKFNPLVRYKFDQVKGSEDGGGTGGAGEKGDKGDKGDPFTYSDFTEEQLAGLKGEKGDKGDKGETGDKGDKGDPFTYSDFTEEQLAGLKGEKGEKGDKGDKGDKGEKGEKGDPGGGTQMEGSEITPEELNTLKGAESNIQQQINNINTKTSVYQDIEVYNWREFLNTVALSNGEYPGKEAVSVRIHLRDNIYYGDTTVRQNSIWGDVYVDLTDSVDLSNCVVNGYDHIIYLENKRLFLLGNYCCFKDVRINASSSVKAQELGSYGTAKLCITSNVSSSRFFFENVVFMNFINLPNERRDIVSTSNTGGVNPSIHLYFYRCVVMSNYVKDHNKIADTTTWTVYNNHNGYYISNLHCLTVTIIDYGGNKKREDVCNKFAFRGYYVEGSRKMEFTSDGSCEYDYEGIDDDRPYRMNDTALRPNYIDVYNPSRKEFDALYDYVMSLELNSGSTGCNTKIISIGSATELSALVEPNSLAENDIVILTDIDSTKTYQYSVNGQTKTFKGNPDYDLVFRYCGNNEFKPVMFSPIV